MDKRTAVAALAEQMERDLGTIRKALSRPLEGEVARGELTAPQMSVMRVVVRNNGISLKELSASVNLAHSTVSGIVDRLERRGMLQRKADAQDARISRIYPTPAVQEFVRDQIPALARRPLQGALERASQAERTAMGDAVRRLRELLEQA